MLERISPELELGVDEDGIFLAIEHKADLRLTTGITEEEAKLLIERLTWLVSDAKG